MIFDNKRTYVVYCCEVKSKNKNKNFHINLKRSKKLTNKTILLTNQILIVNYYYRNRRIWDYSFGLDPRDKSRDAPHDRSKCSKQVVYSVFVKSICWVSLCCWVWGIQFHRFSDSFRFTSLLIEIDFVRTDWIFWRYVCNEVGILDINIIETK